MYQVKNVNSFIVNLKRPSPVAGTCPGVGSGKELTGCDTPLGSKGYDATKKGCAKTARAIKLGLLARMPP